MAPCFEIVSSYMLLLFFLEVHSVVHELITETSETSNTGDPELEVNMLNLSLRKYMRHLINLLYFMFASLKLLLERYNKDQFFHFPILKMLYSFNFAPSNTVPDSL
jgi:hypothetical protein